MLETQVKVLASLYTAILITAAVSLLIFGGFKFKSPMIKGQLIQTMMIDISQIKSLKQAPKSTPKKDPPKKEPIIPKEQPKQQVKPIEKETPKVIPKKIEPKIDIKAQALERNKRIERQKKLEEIRKKRKEAEKRRKIEEQKLKEIADKTKEQATEPVNETLGSQQGQTQQDLTNQLIARYQLSVISAVERQWNKPASATENLLCHVKVRQIPGGGVINATIGSPCNANAIVKKSIIAAIQKADPLPYKGFEKVFDRTATFIFQPQE